MADSLALSAEYHPQNYSLLNEVVESEFGKFVCDSKVITAIEDGTDMLTYSASYNGKRYNTEASVNVGSLPYDVTSTRTATDIVLTRVPESVEVGEEFSCQAYIKSAITAEHPYEYGYSDDNIVVWESNNPDVCRVKNGVVFGMSEGTAVITASDITGNVSKSCSVAVTAKTEITADESETYHVGYDYCDWSDPEDCTQALINLFTMGKKCYVMPEGIVMHVSPVYGTIVIPTETIWDLNGSVLQIMKSELTTSGYLMIQIKDAVNTRVRNGILYGESLQLDAPSGGSDRCRIGEISGLCDNSGFENCEFAYSPGFCNSFGNLNRKVVGIPYASVEAGWIEDGENVNAPYSYRSVIRNISTLGDMIGVGNMQGYGGYKYMSARMFDLVYYDSNQRYLSTMHDCVQYYRYPKPREAMYARICYHWYELPTSGDPDYHAIAHFYSFDMPQRSGFWNCYFHDNYSLACSTNGGESMIIDHCKFVDNGWRDPAGHLDWEDGRQRNKGHILRWCTFENKDARLKNTGGNVELIGADGTSIHNNTFIHCPFSIGDEVQNSRVWLNQFSELARASIKNKTDMVFSQNFGDGTATYTKTETADVDFKIHESSNVF